MRKHRRRRPSLLARLTGCKRKELEAALAEANKKLEATQGELSAEKGKNKTLTEENQTLQQKIAQLEDQIRS
jgi:peptidoglycan hydrolase CwlO-like protein